MAYLPTSILAPSAIQALLLDLDGTLIDSMPLHHESWRIWHSRLGLTFEEAGFFQATAGRTNGEILADMLPAKSEAERARLVELKESLYRDLALQDLQIIAGALGALDGAKAMGLKLAVCTAAPPENIKIAFDRFGFSRWIETTVCPADGFRGKPHPDIFLEAAWRLGVAPELCLVAEDAPLGIEAARRAGMRALALTTTLPANEFTAFDNIVAIRPDWLGIDLKQLITPPETNHA
jgi:HAD superfamily hydrolase (TIGR01509 family)